MRWGLRCIGLVSTLILARLLTPGDFGIIAMAMIFVGFFEVAAYAGVDLALIRKDRLSAAELNSAWTLQLLQGALLSALIFLSSWPISFYMDESKLQPIVAVLAVNGVLGGLRNIGVVHFLKELNFRKEFAYHIVAKVGNFGVIIGAALWFRDYWALVLGSVSGSAIALGLSFLMHPFRPQLRFNGMGEFFSFSQWLVASRVGSFVASKVDQLVIGGQVGTSALGHYHMAHEVSTLPTVELVMPMRRALFPTLSAIRTESAAYGALFERTLATLAILSFPVGWGFASTADIIIPLALGPQWAEATNLARWLAIHAPLAAVVMLFEVSLWVQGRADVSAARSWSELFILGILMILLVPHFGVEGAAMGRLATSAIGLPIGLILGDRYSGVPVSSSFKTLWRPLTASIIMALGVWSIALPVETPPVLALAFKVCSGAFLYLVSLFILWYVSGRDQTHAEVMLLRQLRGHRRSIQE